jgi:hypothetical protein
MIEAIRKLVTEGQLLDARARVRDILSRGVPRDRARTTQLAYLARRSGFPEASLHLLRGVVRGTQSRKTDATEEERAEYGMALAEVGAGREAVSLLAGIDVRKFPWVFHGLTLAYFRQWEWEKARPGIESFLARPGISTHDELWGTYYLARALLHGARARARSRELFERLARAADRHAYPSLSLDAWIGLADACLLDRDWKGALRALAPIEAIELREPASRQGLGVAERRLEAALCRSPRSGAALRELHRLRARLAESGHWEQTRACDLHEALDTGNDEVFLRLYFGTPYPGARRIFLRDLDRRAEDIPEALHWPGPRARATLDLVAGSEALEPGRMPLRVVQALAADLYAPANAVTLFERLYPGQYFHPNAGPARVWQALRGARRALAGTALRIEERSGFYRLEAGPGIRLRLPRPTLEPSGEASKSRSRIEGLLSRLSRELAPAEAFAASRFSAELGISRRSAQRYLGEAVRDGLLSSSGAGRATRYRLV